ncbi:hypothetical protein FB45DRAFT_909888 [Roridomyces roridus]|uniref:Uncharacterized protein n=1 Tax=Roridomyces roridus TaxID=1738132 RepID=A0AAD7BZ87_9AGAR|nr:hypothetical protein FB45DRAFT_909888 [Roridomyces roridus]
MFFSLISFVALIPLLVTSSPTSSYLAARTLDSVPRDASKLAYDPQTGVISVFDKRGELMGTTTAMKREQKRDAGTCATLSASDVKALPGWGALQATAKSNWGNGSYKLATNIDAQSGYPAQACVADSAPVTISGDPDCTTSTQSTGGTLVGTSGTVTLSAQTGTSQQTTTTTTKTAAISLGVSVEAKIGIPDIVDMSSTFTTSLTVTNSLSTAVATTSSNQQTSTIAMTAKEGETCTLTFTHKSCTAHGTGSIDFVATGWVWFQYNDKTHGHYYWALNLEQSLSGSDRTSGMGFTQEVSATDQSNYQGSCA